MSEFQPYFTNDGSVGLYSQNYDDIYHSASGALTEAYEKFIYPVEWDVLLAHDEIKILDICYGIGYNTKSFLNFIFENKKKLLFKKKNLKKFLKINSDINSHIDTIHTDNISSSKAGIYNDTIYTDNVFSKISVTAVDNDEILFGLSPFIKTGVKNFKNDSVVLSKHGIKKYLNKNNKNFPAINNFINYQILSKIVQKSPKIIQNPYVTALLRAPKYNRYFKGDLRGVARYLLCKSSPDKKHLNLHNIYYRYISYCYKSRLQSYKIQNFDLNIQIDDARNVVKNDKNIYNLIFLDAFTPSKCPCLWTYEFFKRLFEIMEIDGMLFTYSSSARIRAAMKAVGFEIGNIYNARLKKYQGTVAVKNISLIKHPLSETDLGLLNSRAGIFYRDENLNASNEAIINAYENEVNNSERISSSQYLKAGRNNGL